MLTDNRNDSLPVSQIHSKKIVIIFFQKKVFDGIRTQVIIMAFCDFDNWAIATFWSNITRNTNYQILCVEHFNKLNAIASKYNQYQPNWTSLNLIADTNQKSLDVFNHWLHSHSHTLIHKNHLCMTWKWNADCGEDDFFFGACDFRSSRMRAENRRLKHFKEILRWVVKRSSVEIKASSLSHSLRLGQVHSSFGGINQLRCSSLLFDRNGVVSFFCFKIEEFDCVLWSLIRLEELILDYLLCK